MRKKISICFLCCCWLGLLFGQNGNNKTTKAKILSQKIVTAKQAEQYETYFYLSLQKAIGLQNEDEYDAAKLLLQSLLIESDNHSITDTLLANIHHKLGVSQYNSGFTELPQAIKNFKKAVQLRKENNVAIYPLLIKGYRNIGIAYNELEQLDSANTYFQKATDLNLQQEKMDTALMANLYQHLGYVLEKKETFVKSENYLNRAYSLYRIIYENEPWELAEIYAILFDLYKKKKDYVAMKKYTNEAITLFESIPNKYKEDYFELANNNNNLGLAYYYSKDSLKYSLDYLQNALTINRRFDRLEYQAINLSNLSLVYKTLKQYPKAIDVIESAIEIDQSINNNIGLASNLNNKMEIYLAMQQFDKALATQQQAIQISLPNFKPNNLLENPKITTVSNNKSYALTDDLADKARILTHIAQAENSLPHWQATAATYDSIAILLNKIRLGFESDKSKSFLAKKARTIFEKAIAANVRVYELTNNPQLLPKIFQLMEQARGMIVLDAFAETNAAKQAGIPQQLLNREINLKNKLNVLEKSAAIDGSNNTDEIIPANRALEQLTDSLTKNYPKYAELKYAAKKIKPSDLVLTNAQLLINYFVGIDAIYVLLQDRNGLELLTIPKEVDLAALIKELNTGILTYHLSKSRSSKAYSNYADTLVDISHQLYTLLIAPIAKKTALPAQLIIVPDGMLGYIPFDLLLKELPEDATLFPSHPYLLKDHQISYTSSVTLLLGMQQKQHQPSNQDFLAFAPEFTADNTMDDRQIAELRGGLGPLAHNVPEVKAIQQLLGGKIYTHKNATEANFLKEAPKYNIIHLSTHGKANDKIGDYAYLAFSEIKDTIENEFLYNRDLYNLQLNADMVVLSACETGIGELQKGEGIISLARGFSYAGAKSIITTLWSVNDAKTKVLMENFYGYIKAGKTKDYALRQAKLDLITNNADAAHPFYWAAFVPIGDMSPIELQGSTCFYWLIGVLGILGFIIFLMMKRNR